MILPERTPLAGRPLPGFGFGKTDVIVTIAVNNKHKVSLILLVFRLFPLWTEIILVPILFTLKL